MSNIGWVKIHRKVFENGMSKDKPYTRLLAWIFMVTMANHNEGFFYVRGNKVTVGRGQLGWSMEHLATQFGWSRGKVKRFLNELEIAQQIIQQKNFVTSLISITNYNKYQCDGTADNTADGQQTVQQTDTNKNVKKNKKKKNTGEIPLVADNPPTLQEVKDYITSKGYNVNAQKFYDYFTDGNWVDSKGNQVRSWKQKIVTWNKDKKQDNLTLDSLCHDFTEDEYRKAMGQ